MKKILFLLIICIIYVANVNADIYPAPINMSATKGTINDTIVITWEAPVPPEFGEGFEAGIVPPTNWDTLTTNADFTWQVMDSPDFAHSGSYAACVPFTYTEGEFLGFDSTEIKNGYFNDWTNGAPDNWTKSSNLIIDTLFISDNILAISSQYKTEYLYQTFSVSKYSKYKFSFKSKQDSLNVDSEYKVEIYDNTNSKSLLKIDTLSNYNWKEHEFDVYSSSCHSIKIKLFPSDSGDSIKIYWDDIKFEKYKYNPNQDEWLISPKYEVGDVDASLIFSLGTSKTFGMNSPLYALLYNYSDGDTLWDTLCVCDGADHDEDYWEYKKHNVSFSEFTNVNAGDSIQIAFRYLGGNGELVCLDDVSIGGEKRDLSEFFVIPVKNPKVKFGSRSPLGNDNRGPILTGYELHRRMYHKDEDFYQIPDDNTFISDIMFADTDVCMDTIYNYKVRAVYNDIIKSDFTSVDTGYVFDDSKPGTPYNLNYTTNNMTHPPGEDKSFNITLDWHHPGSLADDIEYYCIYDDSGGVSVLYDSVANHKDRLVIENNPDDDSDHHQWETRLFKFTVKARDFAGNESEIDTLCEVLTPPYLDTETLSDGDVAITVSKWVDGEDCRLSDSIRIYRSTSEDSPYTLLKLFSAEQDSIDYFEYDDVLDDTYSIIYTDTSTRTDSTYYYYATITYEDNGDFRESQQSEIVETTPVIYLENIDSLEYTETDTSVIFSWLPPEDDLYGGVYLYRGWSYTTPIDTIYKNTTTYEYTDDGIYDFTFWPFDLYGVRWQYYGDGANEDVDKKYLEEQGNILNNVIIGIYEFEDFEDGLTWETFGDGEWQVSDDANSEFFTIQADETGNYTSGQYAWINDDLMGQDYITNSYLVIPSDITLSDSDRVYLKFSSFFGCTPSGIPAPTFFESGYISIFSNNVWNDVVIIIPPSNSADNYIEKWVTMVIEFTPYIDPSVDTEIAFHYNDYGAWAQGWVIDNVALLAASPGKLRSLLGGTGPDIPTPKFSILPNFPNPFTYSTKFSFFLSEPAEVSLEIYNIRGQKISTLINKQLLEGEQDLNWYGKDDNGNSVASGVYFYKICIDNHSKVDKLLLIR